MPYRVAAGRCGAQARRPRRRLRDRAVRRRPGRGDRGARAGPVDVYGDSYGTFFTQVFAGRHPGLVRSVVLDSAYPTYGESAWYPTQAPGDARAPSPRSASARPPAGRRPAVPADAAAGARRGARRAVARHGRTTPTAARCGSGRGRPDAGHRRVRRDVRAGVLPRADRRAAVRRCAATARRCCGWSPRPPAAAPTPGRSRYYSEGLDAAVACHDYPQLYDMTAPPGRCASGQYAAALRRRAPTRTTYGPFTVHEYADSDWQALDWCTRWPSAPASNPAGPPVRRRAPTPTSPCWC